MVEPTDGAMTDRTHPALRQGAAQSPLEGAEWNGKELKGVQGKGYGGGMESFYSFSFRFE